VKVAVLGMGVIGKRLVAALTQQPDVTLAGVAVRSASPAVTAQPAVPYFASTSSAADDLRAAGVQVRGELEDLLGLADLVVDCGPSGSGASRAERYRLAGVDAVYCGGERDPALGPLVHSAANYPVALHNGSVRLASCNTTALARLVAAVGADSITAVRATVLRCSTDTDKAAKGITNGAVFSGAQSHHAADLATLFPGLAASSWAATVPMTSGHTVFVQLGLKGTAAAALAGLRSAPRLRVADDPAGRVHTAALAEQAARQGARWAQRAAVVVQVCRAEGDELVCWLALDNQSITIPEALDVIRARSGVADVVTARALTDLYVKEHMC
jgi:glyceraldehyde-3-phosphate dehydrogenase (NAD(P))